MIQPSSATAKAADTPAFRSQRAFRRLMEAMARPGLIVSLDSPTQAPAQLAIDPPTPLAPAAAEALVALCDVEVTLWLSPAFAGVADWLRFQTDARMAARASDAAFALVAASELDLAAFNPGTPAYPDCGATVVVQCPSLRDGPSLSDGPALTLAGPGIAATQRFAVAGLPGDFVAQAAANRRRFPLGVDLIFASGAQIVALPRSTRILEGR
jgi:alpha-D-ribose 1-methylphosphonate 5-triphosphate synthase subunit PhnH